MIIEYAKTPQELETISQLRGAVPEIHHTTLEVLTNLYYADKLLGSESDEPICVDRSTRISIQQGATLNNLMRAHSVRRSLEIGFAYGFSTVWMLDALRAQHEPLHVAIDPFERSSWHGIGLAQVKRLGLESCFQWVEDYSIHVLSDLIRKRAQFDFIYVDGNHRFDDVVVDFYLSDQVLRPGGVIAFDDLWMQSVRTAVNFVVNNRAYKLVSQPVENMMVLQKEHCDDRDWLHFKAFKVAAESRMSARLLGRSLRRVFRTFGMNRARLRRLWPTKTT
jgi:predicted O-methyltransferase YrrM